MDICLFEKKDIPSVGALWNECVCNGDVLYRKFDAAYFAEKFLNQSYSEKELILVAVEKGEVVGFIAGCRKHEFLRNETEENTPGYLTTIMVKPAFRKTGIGSALLTALETRFRQAGKRYLDVSSLNPIDLDWIIPGTPGHEHNNMPGIDEQGSGYAFLLKRGYAPQVHEVAMYMDLSGYAPSPEVEEKRAALKASGITAGIYDPAENCAFDRMCDRVGSEYWRKVLRDELACEAPRPILAARCDGEIVGFTGPVDLQSNGRGWFTGICTDPEFEKRGIATVLFNDLMCEFKKIGAQYSSLFTGTENHAQRLYLHTGFRPARYFAILRKELV